MERRDSMDDNPIVAAWREQFERAHTNPFLFELLLKQWRRLLKRLAYFYAQLASLPRRKRRALQRALATSLIGAAMLLALSSAPIVHAASITVSGACTLDEAITNANDDAATFPDCAAGSGPDTIYLTGNVTLGTDTPGALPDITSEITLEGNNFFVSGANAFRVFHVLGTGDFTINDTTIKDGRDLDSVGIWNEGGTVTLNNSTVSSNNAYGSGGGIDNRGTLTLNNTTVSGNTGLHGVGGGIDNRGTVTLNNSIVSGNMSTNGPGAGISNYGTLLLTNSTVSGNNATGAYVRGGGIFNSDKATLYNSTVSGNTVTSNNPFGLYGFGGGIYNNDSTLTLINSTVSGNRSNTAGGAIYKRKGTVTLNNTTVSGNDAPLSGGGVFNGPGTLSLYRSLISGNTTVTGVGNEVANFGTVTSGGYNLFGHSGETYADAFYLFIPGVTDFEATSDSYGPSTHVPTALAAILNPTLANNGGPTETHALVTGSPALDKAPNADCTAAPVNGVDQRGFPRNVDFVPPPAANDCDIGAFELQATTAVNVTNVRAIARDGKNILTWRTTTETQIAGFNVYRRVGKGVWKQVNTKFRQAKHAGSALGDKYRFVDKKVNGGKTYRYKIQIVYLDGHIEWTKPVKVKLP